MPIRAKLRYAMELVIILVLPFFGYVMGFFFYVWEYGVEKRRPYRVPGLLKEGESHE